MAIWGDIKDIIFKTEFFDLKIIGDTTSDLVFYWLFKLDYLETTGPTKSKVGMIHYHTKARVTRRLMTLW